MVLGIKIRGKNAFGLAAQCEAAVNIMYLNDVKGNNVLWGAGIAKGDIKKLVLDDVKGRKLLDGAAAAVARRRLVDDEERDKIDKECKIEEILSLVDSMDNKTPKELFEITDKIKEVYESVREKVENV